MSRETVSRRVRHFETWCNYAMVVGRRSRTIDGMHGSCQSLSGGTVD